MSSDFARDLILRVIEDKAQLLADQYYDEYCAYVATIDRKGRSVEELRARCKPVRERFLNILHRFAQILKNEDGNYNYSLRDVESDVEYAIRFVIPGKHRPSDSHDVIHMTQAFYRIVLSAVLNACSERDLERYKAQILEEMTKLLLLTVEHLWVSCVIGFRYQHGLIRDLLYRYMEEQEKARLEFWKEIHDDILQVLATVALKIEALRGSHGDNSKELGSLRGLVKRTIDRIRRLGSNLNPFWSDRKGFLGSLESLRYHLNQRFHLQVNVDVSKEACELLRDVKRPHSLTLFRIIQEALFNSAKHSGARSIHLNISLSDGKLSCSVEDDGKGMDLKALNKRRNRKHIGFYLMRERIESLNGSLSVHSVRNGGTTLLFRIPIESLGRKAHGKDKSPHR